MPLLELYSLGLILLVIACFGAASGAISGFLKNRGAEEELDPGLSAAKKSRINAIAGTIGAFAFVPFGARILDVQFAPIFSYGKPDDTVKNLLFLISLATIGGFAGYRMLSSLTNKMLKELEKRADDLDKRTRSLEESNDILEAKLLESRADLHVAEKRYNYALSVLQEFFLIVKVKEIPSEIIARGYNTQSRALKRLERVDEALRAVELGLGLNNTNPRVIANLLYNKCCYKSIALGHAATEQEALPLVELLRKAHGLAPLKRKEIDDDEDFSNIRATLALEELLHVIPA